MPAPYPQSEVDKWQAYYDPPDWHSIEETAAYFGVGYSTVRRRIDTRSPKEAKRLRNKYQPEDYAAWQAYYDPPDAHTLEEAEERFGVSRRVIASNITTRTPAETARLFTEHTDEVVAKWQAYYNEPHPHSLQETAAHFGVGHSVIAERIETRDLSEAQLIKRDFSEADEERARLFYKTGQIKSIQGVADFLGCSYGTAYRILGDLRRPVQVGHKLQHFDARYERARRAADLVYGRDMLRKEAAQVLDCHPDTVGRLLNFYRTATHPLHA